MAVKSNLKVRGIVLMLVVAGSALSAVPTAETTHIDAGKEYALMVGGEYVRFTARPELGYVAKVKQDTTSIGALSRMLKDFGAVDIRLIRGLGRKSTYIIYNRLPADENVRTIKTLRDYGSSSVINCIFTDNTAESGGGLYNSSNVQVFNCTFAGNSATTDCGIHNQGGTLTLTNCILWNNSPAEIRVGAGTVSVTYSNVQGGFGGIGNIDLDPVFADVDKGDYHLKSQAGRWDPNSKSWQIAISTAGLD